MADSKIVDLSEKSSLDTLEEVYLNDATADKYTTLTSANGYFNSTTGMATGRYYSHPDAEKDGTSLVLTQDRLYYSPVVVGYPETLSGIGINVTTLGATNIRLGLYKHDFDTGLPGALVVDAGTVSASTTGEKEISISTVVTPGLYWAVLVGDATTACKVGTHDTAGISADWHGLTDTTINVQAYVAFTYAALPATFTGTPVYSAADFPLIYVKV